MSNLLHRQLSSFGVLLLTLSSLSPVLSVYGVGGQVLQQAGTGAAGLFLLGLAAAVVWAMVYAELGSAFPYAGGDYVGVGTVLGIEWTGEIAELGPEAKGGKVGDRVMGSGGAAFAGSLPPCP